MKNDAYFHCSVHKRIRTGTERIEENFSSLVDEELKHSESKKQNDVRKRKTNNEIRLLYNSV